jgi:tetratricopeptide (TPR) repeat protein
MIVKDEASIIDRCCEAMARIIDCYLICDTGSCDDTVERIERTFASHGIPGEIVHSTFVDFEQARNEALEAARRSSLDFDYILFCDADMELHQTGTDWRSQLAGPAYGIVQRSVAGLEYPNLRLLRRDHPARYVGVTHEYLDVGTTWPVIDGLLYEDHAVGSSRGHKYERDIRLLTEAAERHPDDARTAFYLANSYHDCGRNDEAMRWYERRISMGGYPDEVFMSMYRAGLCHQALGAEAAFFHQMLLCFDAYPHRAEPLHSLALHAQATGRHRLALSMAELGATIAKPTTGLFVEAEVYEWRLADIIAVSKYWTGRPHDGIAINERLLDIVPSTHRARISDNLEHCRRAANAA